MAGLYFHIPFCRRKCPYCDFYSLADSAGRLEAYPGLLLGHLEIERRQGPRRGSFETVFFGGGTPSLLPPAAIGTILEAVEKRFGLASGAEISLEANPGTVTAASLAGYRAAGVNRLSLGVQSLDRKSLQHLGRIHSPEEAKTAVAWARRAGFDNLSCDLMFALPGQTMAALEEELARCLALEPDHLSAYGLTAEEDTPFYHRHRSGGLDLPDEELCAEFFRTIHDRMERAGYSHYEISNYARPGRQCRHNLRYWRRLPWLGIGAGAHSFVASGWGERRSVPPDLDLFAKALDEGADPAGTLEFFDRRGAMAETLYLGLRTAEGVAQADFVERFGVEPAEAFPQALARTGGHLRLRQGRWRFDLTGWLLYDYFIREFL